MNPVKYVRCFLRATADLFRYRIWVIHVYRVTNEEKAIIIASSKNFRVSSNYRHLEHERVYPNATLISEECKYCGKKLWSWRAGDESEVPLI